jgi:2-phosphosulfolactate phosphatase
VRLDVTLTPAAVTPAVVAGATALVVDVLRASTSLITAIANGCRAVVPVAEVDEARRRAGTIAGALLAGERGGDPPAGFDLGNSPLEFTRARVDGRTLVFTTSNGTRALLAARTAVTVGVAAFANLTAAADWAAGHGRDVVVVCAGELGGRSLEDEVCAGLLVARVQARCPSAVLGEQARDVAGAARAYVDDLARLGRDAPHARSLAARGRGPDVEACLTCDTVGVVPVYRADVDKVVPPHQY